MKQQEETKLETENRIIKEKQEHIEELRERLARTKELLQRKQEEQRQLQKFNDFLESIVQDKGAQGEAKEFEDIEALQNRFKNLKTENEKLMKRKLAINKEMEQARHQEAVKLSELQNTLYEQQRKMQSLQLDLEKISEKNSSLEQDFENEINRKNKNNKEIGQIINSINNIFTICKTQQEHRGKLMQGAPGDVTEKTPNLVVELIKKLDASSEVIEDLKTVLDTVQIEFDVRPLTINSYLERQVLHRGGLRSLAITTASDAAAPGRPVLDGRGGRTEAAEGDQEGHGLAGGGQEHEVRRHRTVIDCLYYLRALLLLAL
jgi:chromosome segregation ATPase